MNFSVKSFLVMCVITRAGDQHADEIYFRFFDQENV